MADDIVAELRASCNCNIETSPCGSEDECRLAWRAADKIEAQAAEIERLRAALNNLPRETMNNLIKAFDL